MTRAARMASNAQRRTSCNYILYKSNDCLSFLDKVHCLRAEPRIQLIGLVRRSSISCFASALCAHAAFTSSNKDDDGVYGRAMAIR
ncbi:hypothetical protein PHMEG_00027317 [Phytophthora megakarya]|uniref:Uncharacterized protein n=1 Tax=Phytophthora megakarya TaxID=4795 RepID=A0A225V8U8_9STRA|nr:hypothetical protein PHMEG_00027317 [Phytophthora megakarya]